MKKIIFVSCLICISQFVFAFQPYGGDRYLKETDNEFVSLVDKIDQDDCFKEFMDVVSGISEITAAKIGEFTTLYLVTGIPRTGFSWVSLTIKHTSPSNIPFSGYIVDVYECEVDKL